MALYGAHSDPHNTADEMHSVFSVHLELGLGLGGISKWHNFPESSAGATAHYDGGRKIVRVRVLPTDRVGSDGLNAEAPPPFGC